jgi:hypothetical protein
MFRETFQELMSWSNTSNPNPPTYFTPTDICIIFKPVWGCIVCIVTRIYNGRSVVQILWETKELSLHQNIQTSSSTHPASNSSFFSGSKVVRADTLTLHICLQPSLKISGAIPPLKLSLYMAHIGTPSFCPNLLPMYISLNRSHPSCSYKGTFLYITYPSHAHYMNHLFHVHWSNYIMNSYNNKPHYIIFCVLLSLNPSIGQIFSG